MKKQILKILKSIMYFPEKKKIILLNEAAFGEYKEFIVSLKFLCSKMEKITSSVIKNELERFQIDITKVQKIPEAEYWYWVEQLEHRYWVNNVSDEIIKALEMSVKFPRKAREKIYSILSQRVNLMDEGEIDFLYYDFDSIQSDIGIPFVIKDEKWNFFNITKGLQPGNLAMILGGSGIGKSILMINFAYWAYIAGYNVIYISLEMTIQKIMQRLWSRITGIQKENLGQPENKQIIEKYKKRFAKKTNHFITKSWPPSQCGAYDIAQYIERIMFKPDLVIIDYMDIMKMPAARSEQEEQGTLGGQLKTLAMSENLAILTGIQLAGIETKQKRVTLRDIGYSKKKGMIADIVFGMNTLPVEEDGKIKKITYFTLAKNRDGRSGMICKMIAD